MVGVPAFLDFFVNRFEVVGAGEGNNVRALSLVAPFRRNVCFVLGGGLMKAQLGIVDDIVSWNWCVCGGGVLLERVLVLIGGGCIVLFESNNVFGREVGKRGLGC